MTRTAEVKGSRSLFFGILHLDPASHKLGAALIVKLKHGANEIGLSVRFNIRFQLGLIVPEIASCALLR